MKLPNAVLLVFEFLFLGFLSSSCHATEYEDIFKLFFLKHKEYSVKKFELDAYRNSPPSMATLWNIPQDSFQLNAYVSEACQAIQLCTVPKINLKSDKLTVDKSITCASKNSFLYLPYENKIWSEKTSYEYMFPTIKFRKDYSSNKADFKVNFHEGFDGDVTSKTKQATFSLSSADFFLLVLTDSPACDASISSEYEETVYYQIPDFGGSASASGILVFKDKAGGDLYSDFPKQGATRNYENLQVHPVAGVPAPTKSTKSCPKFYRVRRHYESAQLKPVKQVSYLVHNLARATAPTGSNVVNSFRISIGVCEWIRVCLDTTGDWNACKVGKEKNSFDILVDGGMLIPTDNDDARPLALSDVQLKDVYVRFNSGNRIDLLYGGTSGRRPAYAQRMTTEIDLLKVKRVILIRSEQCEAGLFNDVGYEVQKPPTEKQLLYFDNCEMYTA